MTTRAWQIRCIICRRRRCYGRTKVHDWLWLTNECENVVKKFIYLFGVVESARSHSRTIFTNIFIQHIYILLIFIDFCLLRRWDCGFSIYSFFGINNKLNYRYSFLSHLSNFDLCIYLFAFIILFSSFT